MWTRGARKNSINALQSLPVARFEKYLGGRVVYVVKIVEIFGSIARRGVVARSFWDVGVR